MASSVIQKPDRCRYIMAGIAYSSWLGRRSFKDAPDVSEVNLRTRVGHRR
jgi:hypothetical protein